MSLQFTLGSFSGTSPLLFSVFTSPELSRSHLLVCHSGRLTATVIGGDTPHLECGNAGWLSQRSHDRPPPEPPPLRKGPLSSRGKKTNPLLSKWAEPPPPKSASPIPPHPPHSLSLFIISAVLQIVLGRSDWSTWW